MKLKEDFIVRKIVDNHMIVPVGSRVIDFKGLMDLTPTGAFVCGLLEKGASYEEILAALTENYDVEPAEAKKDLDDFLAQLRQLGVLDE